MKWVKMTMAKNGEEKTGNEKDLMTTGLTEEGEALFADRLLVSVCRHGDNPATFRVVLGFGLLGFWLVRGLSVLAFGWQGGRRGGMGGQYVEGTCHC